MDEQTPLPATLIPLLTTEHFTLQSARAIVMAEIGTRATIYLTAVSSTVVALAFVTTLSGDERIIRGVAARSMDQNEHADDRFVLHLQRMRAIDHGTLRSAPEAHPLGAG